MNHGAISEVRMFQRQNETNRELTKAKDATFNFMTKKQNARQPKFQEETVTDIAEDRRRKKRYPMNLQVEYKIVKNYLVVGNGTGTTIDMSSSGIAFQTDQPLKVGSYLEVSASWPVLLDGSCPLKLVVFGKVVRSDGQITAIAADRHEFRTRKAGTLQAHAAPLAMAAGFR